MGVFISSCSCLMTSRRPGRGLFGSAEGRARVAVLGVFKAGNSGFGDLGILMVGGTGFVGSAEGMIACRDRQVGETVLSIE